jgi:hypothetical protein
VLKLLWASWLGLTAAAAGWLMMALPSDAPPTSASKVFLPGETSHGHYQIEMKCSACHLGNGGVTDQSCIDCHGKDLKQSRDTHPKSKFSDPTKALLLQKIDAQNCLSCHVEHQEERTHAMGVSVPLDYCWHCHQDVGKDRPSHKGMEFNSCANAGCHNYHDNTALYENFLHKHTGEPDVLSKPQNSMRKLQQWLAEHGGTSHKQLKPDDTDAPAEWQSPAAVEAWAMSAHALAGVNCSGCHLNSKQPDNVDAAAWTVSPDHQVCASCHDSEVSGFLKGKHGMRLGSGLTEMTPDLARLPMHAAAGHKLLNCYSCHDAHNPDLKLAAFDACISCHDDSHSQAFAGSSHYLLWQRELNGESKINTGVSCATCHMPRDKSGRVNHNQNANLRPNEKMARTVCLNCHGLQFTLDSLADPDLKANCYLSPPTSTVKSLKMVGEWFESKKRGRSGVSD